MPRRPTSRTEAIPATTLRIIGGKLRGSKISFNGDPATRPMKERVREAVFNLVGPSIKGTLAVDLFAGTGALGLEALSRGAAQALFIERHRPTAKTLLENISVLGVGEDSQVVQSDTFFWARDLPDCLRENADKGSSAALPWVVFCSPPYALYRERTDDMLRLIEACMADAPAGSSVLVETDGEFDYESLPQPEKWDVRNYFPAVLGIWRPAST
jgi:16S rRNA (guanine(966)-N(2))-methyltransferase RsmD